MLRLFALLPLWLALVLTGVTHGQDKPKKDSADKKESGPPKVTAGTVSYVVNKSAIGADGQSWTVVLEATSTSGDQKIFIQNARAISTDGKTFEVKSPMGRANKPVSLPEGVKIQLELKLGDLPKTVTALSRLELYGDRVTGIPGFEIQKKGLKVTIRPLVLQNVPIERAAK